eukprot:4376916-Pleurochrysis_carterae.AAC.1
MQGRNADARASAGCEPVGGQADAEPCDGHGDTLAMGRGAHARTRRRIQVGRYTHPRARRRAKARAEGMSPSSSLSGHVLVCTDLASLVPAMTGS